MEALLSNHGTFGKTFSTQTLTLFSLLVLQLTTPTFAIFTPPEVIFRPSVITNCSMPLLECPISSTARAIREFCVMGFQANTCPLGTHYGCGEDVTYGYLTEGCFTRKICEPGTSNRIILDIRRNMTHLECVPCDDNHYQPLPADSLNDSLKGCSMERKSFTIRQQIDHMILVHIGWPTRPDIYSCNYAQGYSDALKHMYCDVTTPCACTNNIFCLHRESPELLPDGSCEGRCAIIRNIERNYSCASYESEDIWDEQLGAELKKFILVVIFILSVCFFCFSYFLARRRYRKKEVRGTSRRGSLVPLERVSLTKRRVSFSPELTKRDNGIKALELVIDPVDEADEEDEVGQNVKTNSGNKNAEPILEGRADQKPVNTTEGEVPRLEALQNRPKCYLSIPENKETYVGRVSIDKYSDTDKESVHEKAQQKFYTVEEIPTDIVRDKIKYGNRKNGHTDEYKLLFAETFPSVHQKYQYLLDLKRKIEETIIETSCMETVEGSKCENCSAETTMPTVIRFLIKSTGRFDPLRLMENASDTNMPRTQINKVEKKGSSIDVVGERKQSSQLMENMQEVKACQHNNVDVKTDSCLKAQRHTGSISNTNMSDTVVKLSNNSDTLIRQATNTGSTEDNTGTSTRFNGFSHMNDESKDNNRHKEQINKTNILMTPMARVNSAHKPTIIEGTSKGFQYKHFIDSLCNSVTAPVQLIIVEMEDTHTSSFPVEAIAEDINFFRNLEPESFETSTVVICDVLQHVSDFRSIQLDVANALTRNFGTNHIFDKNIDLGLKGHNISRKVSAFIEKRVLGAFRGIQTILEDIGSTTENEHNHRKIQTIVQEINGYLR